MIIKPLTKVDVTRYAITDWRVLFLASHGFRIKCGPRKVFMVREA